MLVQWVIVDSSHVPQAVNGQDDIWTLLLIDHHAVDCRLLTEEQEGGGSCTGRQKPLHLKYSPSNQHVSTVALDVPIKYPLNAVFNNLRRLKAGFEVCHRQKPLCHLLKQTGFIHLLTENLTATLSAWVFACHYPVCLTSTLREEGTKMGTLGYVHSIVKTPKRYGSETSYCKHAFAFWFQFLFLTH